MAHKHNFAFVLLLLATSALAQTMDSKKVTVNDQPSDAQVKQIKNDQSFPKQVVLARCAYSHTDEGCPGTSVPPAASNAAATTLLAQMPRRMGPMGQQGPPMRGAAYPETSGPQFSPGHALIGAAIGFGFGAAAGSKSGVRGSIAVGTLVGLLGAAIGAGIPSFPHYRRRGWDDEEEASQTKLKPAKPDASHPNSDEQVTASRQEATETETYQKNDFSGR